MYLSKLHENPDSFPEAKCFRDSIERRIPGIVFCIEFFPVGKESGEKITFLEEERIKNEGEEQYYKNRLIHVFLKPSKKAPRHLEIIRQAMKEAISVTIKDESKVKKAVANCGLRCLQCIHPEGYLRGDMQYWRCNQNEKHVIDYKKAITDPNFNDDQTFVIRRYAYLVSKMVYLFLMIILGIHK